MNVNGHKRAFAGIILLLFLVAVSGCASRFEAVDTEAAQPVPPAKEEQTVLPTFELPVPSDKAAQEYLGVAGPDTFKTSDIKAKVLVIEVFNMYCPHCQKDAPNVNELYEALQEDENLKNTIKLIGIGIGNTPYEVNLFREKYDIVFPLFPDPDMSVGKMLGVLGTPTFIGVNIDQDGTAHAFYFKSGKMGSVDKFLDKMVSMSGPDKE